VLVFVVFHLRAAGGGGAGEKQIKKKSGSQKWPVSGEMRVGEGGKRGKTRAAQS
jgi:hypothetical protein